jgi:hypothetical protein
MIDIDQERASLQYGARTLVSIWLPVIAAQRLPLAGVPPSVL